MVLIIVPVLNMVVPVRCIVQIVVPVLNMALIIVPVHIYIRYVLMNIDRP